MVLAEPARVRGFRHEVRIYSIFDFIAVFLQIVEQAFHSKGQRQTFLAVGIGSAQLKLFLRRRFQSNGINTDVPEGCLKAPGCRISH